MPENNSVATRQMTPAERFTVESMKQYASDVGRVEISEYEKVLLQHVYIRVDMAIIQYNVDHKNEPDISWYNINMRKLAIDAANRVKLGLDALIPGHMYAILYKNGKQENLYDIDLRIGYKGEEFFTQKGALHPIKRIYKRLVYGNEKLIVHPAGMNNPVEGYELILGEDPFNRGDLRGGFAYIEYEDPTLNELIVMSKADIEKRRAVAMSGKFWNAWYDEMCLKTIIHKAAGTIILDPEKVNSSALAAVNAEDEIDYGDQPLGNGQEITLPQDYGIPAQQSLPPQQPTIPDPIVPEGFTVNQAAPARDKAPAPRQSVPSPAQQQSMCQDDAPDFLRDMGGGTSGKKEPF